MTAALDEQIEEVGKEIRDRERRYPVMVEKGRLLKETADRKLNVMRRVHDTLSIIRMHQDWIRPGLARRIEDRKAREAAENHPVVQAIKEEFPGAEVSAVRHVDPPESPDVTGLPDNPDGSESLEDE